MGLQSNTMRAIQSLPSHLCLFAIVMAALGGCGGRPRASLYGKMVELAQYHPYRDDAPVFEALERCGGRDALISIVFEVNWGSVYISKHEVADGVLYYKETTLSRLKDAPGDVGDWDLVYQTNNVDHVRTYREIYSRFANLPEQHGRQPPVRRGLSHRQGWVFCCSVGKCFALEGRSIEIASSLDIALCGRKSVDGREESSVPFLSGDCDYDTCSVTKLPTSDVALLCHVLGVFDVLVNHRHNQAVGLGQPPKSPDDGSDGAGSDDDK